MSAPLSSLIADKLGLSEDHAESLLKRLAQEIRSHADENGIHVSGLGTFRDDEGTLTFEPVPSLAQAVNEDFEGLEPIDAPTAPPPDAPEPAESGDRHMTLSPLAPPPQLDRRPEAFSLQSSDASADQPEVWAPLNSSTAPSEPEESVSDDEPAEEASQTPSTPKTRTSRPQRDRSAGPRIAAGILVLLFLLGAGWLILGQQGLVSSPRSVFSEGEGTATPPTEEQAEESSTADAATSDTSGASADTLQADSDTTGATEAPSTAVPAARWTLVVASRTARADADAQADTYRSRFSGSELSVRIRTTETDNTTRHRVVLGEFDSKANALEAMETHRSRLPDGVWLLRIE